MKDSDVTTGDPFCCIYSRLYRGHLFARSALNPGQLLRAPNLQLFSGDRCRANCFFSVVTKRRTLVILLRESTLCPQAFKVDSQQNKTCLVHINAV
jgi:hypothetical protein